MFDIPSYALIINNINNNILILFTLFEKKGINAFVLSTGIDKLFNSILSQQPEIDTQKILQDLHIQINNLFPAEAVYSILSHIDLKNKTLKYSGNGLPMFIYRNHKMVEIYHKDNQTNKFESHKLALNNDDIIYLLCDGFINPDNYKNDEFVSAGMIEILKKHADIDFSNQKKEFDTFFHNSKEDLRQQNDMLVIGIKI